MAEPTPQKTTLVILLGASEFPRANLSGSASFANSAQAIEEYFRSPKGFGLPPANLLREFNSPKTSPDVNDEIGAFLERRIATLDAEGTPATDVVVYYVGHGGFGDQEAYFLALYDTRAGNELHSSFPITVLANTLRQKARHLRRYLILDACFSSAAYASFMSTGPLEVARQKASEAFPESGTALLCASGPRDPAKAPPGERYTMFSGALHEVLVHGSAEAGGLLSLADVGRLTEQVIVEQYENEAVRPEVHSPHRRDGDVGVFPLFPNHASQGIVLPAGLPEMLEDRNPMIREGAYRILGGWLTDSDESRVRFAREKLQEFRDAEDRVAPRDAIDEIFRVNTTQQVEPEAEALRAQLDMQRQALRKKARFWMYILGGISFILAVLLLAGIGKRGPVSGVQLKQTENLENQMARLEAEQVEKAQRIATQLKQIDDLKLQIASIEAEKAQRIAAQKELPSQLPPQAFPQTLTEHGIEFVLIPAGEFMMGSPDSEAERRADEHQRRVRISNAFYLGTYEVTQGQWEAVMGSNPSRFQGDPNRPVEKVSWDEVQAFLQKLNAQEGVTHYRLPTEAEWEYAARAGTTTVFHYGDRLDATQANFDGNYPYGGANKGPYLKRTTAVGSYQANAFGLYDMHGNVWEWVQDWYDKDYYKSSLARDPQGPDSGVDRVLRGGSWIDVGGNARSALRDRVDLGDRDLGTGFRFARGQASSK